MIESYHRQLRKVTKGKSIFPTDEALLKMLYLVTMDVTRKLDRPCPKLGSNAAPALRFLSGTDRSASTVRVNLPFRGESL
jgi:transposase-like protein